jgi:hypothetical protein
MYHNIEEKARIFQASGLIDVTQGLQFFRGPDWGQAKISSTQLDITVKSPYD